MFLPSSGRLGEGWKERRLRGKYFGMAEGLKGGIPEGRRCVGRCAHRAGPQRQRNRMRICMGQPKATACGWPIPRSRVIDRIVKVGKAGNPVERHHDHDRRRHRTRDLIGRDHVHSRRLEFGAYARSAVGLREARGILDANACKSVRNRASAQAGFRATCVGTAGDCPRS